MSAVPVFSYPLFSADEAIARHRRVICHSQHALRVWTMKFTSQSLRPLCRKATRQVQNQPQMKAFYSSVVGGICLDPEVVLAPRCDEATAKRRSCADSFPLPQAFIVPVDDHGFHRGHACFDTCNIAAG